MRVPVEWLRSLTPLEAPAAEIARRLTDAGFEVEKVHRSGEAWDRIVVGRVVRVDPHPNADRLNLPVVDTGGGETQVVCGAWNFKAGDKIAFAHTGAELWDAYAAEPTRKRLKPAKIRGVASEGMLCSPKELGLSEAHEGILVLDPDAPVGTPLADVLGENVIEFELKANRPDALSMVGIAREAAALFDAPLHVPGPMEADGRAVVELEAAIEIEDPDLCARYSAAFVQDVQVGESPAWMRRRLELAGMRPINSIVDVTNYVMLELGQPLHAFDWDKLRGDTVVIRAARAGERLLTLDGQERELTGDTLVIADTERPIALAGVMGGLETEVTPATRTVLLESATFNPYSIRRTAQRLGLRSEASRRFEKGLPPELTTQALARTVQLLEEIGAGRGELLSSDAYPRPAAVDPVRLGYADIERLVGVSYPRAQVRSVLQAVGFEITDEGESLVVQPPFWRRDVRSPADVIEDVARLIGYDVIPDTLPAGRTAAGYASESNPREDDVRDILVSLGFTECVSYAMTSVTRMERLIPTTETSGGAPQGGVASERDGMNEAGRAVRDRLLPLDRAPLKLLNPLSADEDTMRLTALSTLLETLRANRRHADRDLLLFEYGANFWPRDGDLPEERRQVTLVAGARVSAGRWNETREVDLLLLKGLLDECLHRLGVQSETRDGREPALRHVALKHPTFEAAQAAAVALNDEIVAAYGQIDPAVAAAFDLDEPTWAALLDMPRILALSEPTRAFAPWSQYPPARRDLAIVVGKHVAAQEVELTIRRSGRGLVQDLRLFDEFRGAQVAPGKRSLAFAISYGSHDRTLTDDEVDKVHAQIVRALGKRFEAELRS